MEDVRRALAVSIGSRGFAALLGLLALPLYVRFLGIEAYGVVGLFASLQVLVAFMDLGLATALTRELAGVGRDAEKADGGAIVRAYFREGIPVPRRPYRPAAGAAASLVASRWVNLEALTADQVTRALESAGIALACQWPSNLYSAGLAGLHRQTALAVSSSGLAAARVALSLFALWQWPTLESFFWRRSQAPCCSRS